MVNPDDIWNNPDVIEPLTPEQHNTLTTMEGHVTLGLLYVMLEDMRQELNAVRKDLARIEPLVQYAEQYLQQKERIAKWIPGRK